MYFHFYFIYFWFYLFIYLGMEGRKRFGGSTLPSSRMAVELAFLARSFYHNLPHGHSLWLPYKEGERSPNRRLRGQIPLMALAPTHDLLSGAICM